MASRKVRERRRLEKIQYMEMLHEAREAKKEEPKKEKPKKKAEPKKRTPKKK